MIAKRDSFLKKCPYYEILMTDELNLNLSLVFFQ